MLEIWTEMNVSSHLSSKIFTNTGNVSTDSITTLQFQISRKYVQEFSSHCMQTERTSLQSICHWNNET